jgi:tRNA modification GTPase
MEESIAAICAGAGGAIAIIRISGRNCLEIASKAWRCESSPDALAQAPRRMILGKTLSAEKNELGEPCLAVFMPAPRSYTGEDVVELHCHGGAAAPKRLLAACLKAGARSAAPGEFTRRAFINGKMDLTQAEAVADIVNAKSSAALALAERQISGALGKTVRSLREPLSDVLAEMESRLDFPEEDLAWKSPAELARAIASCEEGLARLLRSRRDGALLRDGVRLVIAGRPNVGKSSLLNALLGYERAIVSEIPGTTRDTIEELASIGGIPVRITDTAGLRESSDRIESLGVERSRQSLQGAEAALWLLDASAAKPEEELAQLESERLPQGVPAIAVWNKADLRRKDAPPLPSCGLPSVCVSALKGEGLEELAELFAKTLWGSETHSEPEAAVSARHSALLEEAIPALAETRAEIAAERWELAASSLRAAFRALGEITGESASPDVLDMIFSRFCIGK